MNIKLNQKEIKDLCGPVSFKRGEAFYRADKVSLKKYDDELAEAVVTGGDEFRVTVKTTVDGGFSTECSCPKLASFKNECQHIAAVLLAIVDQQKIDTGRTSIKLEKVDGIAGDVLSIFAEKQRKSTGHQHHFESRNVLNTEFRVIPVENSEKQTMLAIALKIGTLDVQNIWAFLKSVNNREAIRISPLFTYDPLLHCFENRADEVLQQLIVLEDSLSSLDGSKEMLLIPPSVWPTIFPLLEKTSNVKIDFAGKACDFLLSIEKLPLLFDFEQTIDKDYDLKIEGFHAIRVLHLYDLVLFEGRFVRIDREDCDRLYQLKQILEGNGGNKIPIQKGQIRFFVEKVVPGLRRVGEVRINGDVAKEFMQAPLIAKLYLDRVNNRLLAGIEFQYDNIIFNPLEHREPQAQSFLVRDLEKENLILELMEESSFAKTEGGYSLHNEELEYEFLYHKISKLQKLVQIYATTAVRNRIFRKPSRPQIRVKAIKERTNWLEFKFEMDGIPERQIRDLLLALEEKRKYYRMPNGSLLSLQTKEFEEIQRFLKRGPTQSVDLEKGLNLPFISGMKLMDSISDENILMLEDSFRKFLDEFANPKDFQVPVRLQVVLREYQQKGYRWLKTLASYGFGGILADDMGLGKTLQSIAFIQSELPIIRKKKQPVLIVCPSSLTYNWLSEFMKFTPDIQALIMDGYKTERIELFKEASEMDVVITSYMLLRRDIHLYEKMIFHAVFFDEAQAFKNPATQTAKAAMSIKADHRFALTGTPVENSTVELWSIFRVVFPELFGGLKEYSNMTSKTISRRVRPFLMRRVKEDVLQELPEKTQAVDTVELLPDQKKLYAAYLAKLRYKTLKHLDKETLRKNRIKILSGLTRLRQICCHPALFVDGYQGSSAKLEQLLEIIEESRLSGRRVLIFSQFTKMLRIIGGELSQMGFPYFFLDGQTPSAERLDLCDRFNEGERDFFLVSLKAGGTGLNLTGADTVILYDVWWNPAVEDQAADRAHRIGQKNPVQVIKLISRGTIEEKMNELQDKKRKMVEEIIEEKGSVTLTEDDIREILMM